MKRFSKKTVAAATALIVVGVSVWFYYHSSHILNSRAHSWDKENRPFLFGAIISRAFKIPVNYEWWDLGIGHGNLPLEIQFGERLRDVLDKMIRVTDNMLTYEVIHGQLCIFPAKQHEHDILSPLDLRVTVNLSMMSTWEAIKQVTIALNQQKDVLDKPVFTVPEEVEGAQVINPLLTRPRKINLLLQNVTAREALCAIFAKSGLDIDYRFGERSKYYILTVISHQDRFFNSLNRRPERVYLEEACWWFREVNEQAANWEVVPPYYEMQRACTNLPTSFDIRVSIDLTNASLWEAVKMVVAEVNKQTGDVQPLEVLPDELNYDERPAPELTELREITLSLQDVTVQEALDAVVAASSLDLSYWYEWQEESSRLLIITQEEGEYREHAAQLTPEEREWWLSERGRRQESEDPPVWIWKPLGMDTPFEHHSNGRLIPIVKPAQQKE